MKIIWSQWIGAFCLVMINSQMSHAASIKQLIVGESNAAVILTDEEKEKKYQFLLATFQGRQCRLPILSLQGNLAKVSTKDCPFRDQLVIDQIVEPPLIDEPPSEIKNELKPTTNLQVENGDRPDEAISKITRELKDLFYLPMQGQSLVNFSLSTRKFYQEVRVAGTLFFTDNVREESMELSYLYGITDNLAVGLTLPILLVGESDYKYGPASTVNGKSVNLVTDGVRDPTIEFGYRGLEQSNKSSMNLDVLFGYLAKTQEVKPATDDEKGNAARGGDGFKASLLLSRKMEQLSFLISIEHMSLNTRTEKSGATKIETSGGNQLTSQVSGQIELNESTAIEGSVGYISISSTDSKAGSSVITIGSYNLSTLGIGIKHSIVADRIFMRLGILHANSASTKITISNSALDASMDGHEKYIAGLTFLF
jgi:hypothetical protein